MSRIVMLSSEDHAELVKRYREAQNTPVIYFNGPRSMADIEWDSVKRFMDELGKKYGYNPRTARITMDSPSVEVEE